MNLRNITSLFASKVFKTLDTVHGALFSAADFSDAIKVYDHAKNGEHYHPELGVYGTFDANDEHGQSIIRITRDKLYSAKQAYDRMYGGNSGMISSDNILRDELEAY